MPSNTLAHPSMLSYGLTSSHILASPRTPLHDLVRLHRTLHVLSHSYTPSHALAYPHTLLHFLIQAHMSSHALPPSCTSSPMLAHPHTVSYALMCSCTLLQVFAIPCKLSHTHMTSNALVCLCKPAHTTACAFPSLHALMPLLAFPPPCMP